jgi:hypothetical protein
MSGDVHVRFCEPLEGRFLRVTRRNVSLGSRTAAEHAFETTKRYLERELKLQINLNKSGVAPANRRDFLGYGLIGRETARLKVALHSVQRLRHQVKDLMRAGRGCSVAATSETLSTRCCAAGQATSGAPRSRTCGRSWTGGSGANCGADCGANASAPTPGPRC